MGKMLDQALKRPITGDRRFNPAQKQNVKRRACKKCQSTGYCHAMQRCEETGRALRIVRN